MLFQSGNLLPHLTVTGNIELAQRPGRPRRPARTSPTCWPSSGHRVAGPPPTPANCPAASWPAPGLAVALANRPGGARWPTNRPANSTPTPKPRCWTCSRPAAETRGGDPGWPATAPPSPPPPTASSPSTDGAVTAMTTAPSPATSPPRPGTAAGSRLAPGRPACGVAHTYGSRHGPPCVAVHDVTCRRAASTRVAVTGPSGSGKSTLLHLMAGLETRHRPGP